MALAFLIQFRTFLLLFLMFNIGFYLNIVQLSIIKYTRRATCIRCGHRLLLSAATAVVDRTRTHHTIINNLLAPDLLTENVHDEIFQFYFVGQEKKWFLSFSAPPSPLCLSVFVPLFSTVPLHTICVFDTNTIYYRYSYTLCGYRRLNFCDVNQHLHQSTGSTGEK